jgi:outer membrane protein OmpA-like peptidoglycan-associated protein
MMTKRFLILAAMIFGVLNCLSPSPTANGQSGDVRRRTVAITYLKDPVTVRFAGTTLRPNAKAEATVERWRKRNESEIDITIENMIPAFNYGADYTTYVLWALTPAGQVDNLGEFRLSGSTARLKAATPQQTFAMIVTAEPHYLVKLPSKMVILENLAPTSKNVTVQASEISFTGDSGRYYTDNTAPAIAERDYNKTPMELLQARRAMQIAKLADGERFDPDDFNQARRLLSQAEDSFRRGDKVHETGRIARDSISLAVRARDISEERAIAAERRSEIARRDAEVARANETASDLSSRLQDAETRFKASEISRVSAQEQLDRSLHEAADARAENRSLRADNDRLQGEIERLSQDLASARSRVSELQSQYSTTNAKLVDASSRADAMEREARERELAEARRRDIAELQAVIAGIAQVRAMGGGFVAVLPDTYFVPNQTTLHVRVKTKMDALAQSLAAHKDVVFTIEGHSDARPNADGFALARAQAVGDYIAAFGVSRTNFRVESRGATAPLSTKKTIAAKAMNRRVELVFAPLK